MRDRRRNQKKFWYSLYLGKEPVKKNGFETGQYNENYSEPVEAWAYISPASGDSEADMFGAAVKYDRVVSSVQNLPIDEYSRLWVDSEPCGNKPHDYVVKRVAKGLNRNLWAIERVTR